jgi:hypothetical protein
LTLQHIVVDEKKLTVKDIGQHVCVADCLTLTLVDIIGIHIGFEPNDLLKKTK